MVQHSNPLLQQCDFFPNPESACSLSIPSEPPDIGNWFSSYEYESPELDTGDDIRSSLPSETASKRRGFAVEESNQEKEGNFFESSGTSNQDKLVVADNQSTETQNSLDVLSPPSEPPDIRNWFSSYAYESPAPDTLDNFGFPLTQKGEGEKSGFVVGEEDSQEKEENIQENRKIRRKDELVFGGKMDSKWYVRCKSSTLDNKHIYQSTNKENDGVEGSKNRFAQNNLCSGRIVEQSLENNSFPKHEFDALNESKKLSLNDEDNQWKLQRKFSGSGDPDLLRVSSMKNEQSSQTEKYGSISSKGNTSAAEVDGTFTKKSSRGDVKENEGQGNARNGFISTRKSGGARENNMKSLKKPLEGKVSCPGEKDSGGPRKVLSERSNFHHFGELEIAGKWRCPQNTKPYIGPPLKQLRLERWVNRL